MKKIVPMVRKEMTKAMMALLFNNKEALIPIKVLVRVM